MSGIEWLGTALLLLGSLLGVIGGIGVLRFPISSPGCTLRV